MGFEPPPFIFFIPLSFHIITLYNPFPTFTPFIISLPNLVTNTIFFTNLTTHPFSVNTPTLTKFLFNTVHTAPSLTSNSFSHLSFQSSLQYLLLLHLPHLL